MNKIDKLPYGGETAEVFYAVSKEQLTTEQLNDLSKKIVEKDNKSFVIAKDVPTRLKDLIKVAETNPCATTEDGKAIGFSSIRATYTSLTSNNNGMINVPKCEAMDKFFNGKNIVQNLYLYLHTEKVTSELKCNIFKNGSILNIHFKN